MAVSVMGYLSWLIMSLVCVPGGYIADYYGRKKIMVVGTYLRGLVIFFVAVAPDWTTLILANSIRAAFWWHTVAEYAAIMDAMPEDDRATAWATFSTIVSVTNLPAPIIGGYLFDTYGVAALRWAWVATGIADLGAATVYWKCLKESLITPEKPPKGLGLTPLAKFRTLMVESFREAMGVLKWMPKDLKTLLGVMVIVSFGGSLTGAFWIVYALDTVGITATEWGLIGTVSTVLQFALSIPGGKLADKYGKMKLLYMDVLVGPLGILGFILSRNFPQMFLARILPSTVSILAGPVWSAIETDMMPKEKRGRLQAVLPFFFMPTSMVGSVLGGWLYGIQEVYPFYLNIAASVLFIPLFIKYVKEPKKPPE